MKVDKLAWAVFAVVVLVVALWCTSPYFRAWIKYPARMYHCTVEKKLPAAMCVGATQWGELARAGGNKP